MKEYFGIKQVHKWQLTIKVCITSDIITKSARNRNNMGGFKKNAIIWTMKEEKSFRRRD